MYNTFIEYWHNARWIVVCCAFAAFIMMTIFGNSYVLDVEFRGPEMQQLEQTYNDKRDQEAADRVRDDEREGRESSERDRERAERHNDKHNA